MDYYEYKPLKISPYKADFVKVLKKYEESKNHTEQMKQIFKIIIENTFDKKENNAQIDLKEVFRDLTKRQVYYNNNLNIKKYLDKHIKDREWDNLYINANKGRAYIEIRNKRTANEITECYLDNLISFVESSRKNDIISISIFCNIDILLFEQKLKKFFEIVTQKKIKTLYMSNYSHVSLKDEVTSVLKIIFTEREKALNHFVCIITEKSRTSPIIIKRDPTTGINFRYSDDNTGKILSKVSPYFLRHHANRMQKIMEDSKYVKATDYLPIDLLAKYTDEYREDVEERHTILLSEPKETLTPTETKILGNYLHNLSIYDAKLSASINNDEKKAHILRKEYELKLLRNKCLKEYNLIHIITNANTSILKTAVWMIYSLKLLELYDDKKQNNELRQILDDTQQNSQIWGTIRQFRKFFTVTSPFPLIQEDQVPLVLRKIYFNDKCLSKYFPDIAFSADLYSLQDSLETLIFDDRLRMRLSQFFDKNLLSQEEAAEALSRYLKLS